MARETKRETGLYKNGNLWWVRVRGPISRTVKPRSTGTADLALANRIARKLEELAENRPLWPWLERIVAGEVSLDRVYDHAAAGSLDALARELEAAAAAGSDVDVEPWVKKWQTEHLEVRDISPTQKADYVRMLRVLIPAGAPFPRSKFTEECVKMALLGLKDRRSGKPVSSNTRRHYLAAWEQFYRWARKRVPLEVNPFDDVQEWRPAPGRARATYWDHATRLSVLEKMTGEARVYMTLVLGSGIEEGAADELLVKDIGQQLEDGRLLIVAHATTQGKNRHREQRTIFVDAWAAPAVLEHARLKLPTAPLFALHSDRVRDQFYQAQVDAGLIEKPPMSKHYKPLWRVVHPHTIHDGRHTYAVCRALGLDDEARQDPKFIATNLGHADEQMVLRIYSKANIRERLKLIELREAKRAGKEAAR